MNAASIIFVSLLFSAFFSGMEMAFVSASRLRIEVDRKHGKLSARIISVFLRRPGNFIATMLIGNNIALVVYGIMVARLLEPLIITYLNLHNGLTILLIQITAGTIIILFTAEFLPKTLFRNRPNLALRLFAIPALVIWLLLFPITILIIGITNLLFHISFGMKKGDRPGIQPYVFGKVDLDHLVSESQSPRKVHAEDHPEKIIFRNALEFSSRKVRDCMAPRTEVVAVDVHDKLDELKVKFFESGYSKILVYDGSVDNMIGYVNSKVLFRNIKSIQSGLLPLLIVPETMPVSKLFRKLIRERKTISLVVDEFGGTSGIITLEDIIEEIFGEIEDEHDTSDFVERQINENEYIFSGRLEIDYLVDKYNFNFDDSEDYDTLAGMIIHHYQSIPRLNTNVRIPPYEFRVLKVGQTRIELVKMRKI